MEDTDQSKFLKNTAREPGQVVQLVIVLSRYVRAHTKINQGALAGVALVD